MTFPVMTGAVRAVSDHCRGSHYVSRVTLTDRTLVKSSWAPPPRRACISSVHWLVLFTSRLALPLHTCVLCCSVRIWPVKMFSFSVSFKTNITWSIQEGAKTIQGWILISERGQINKYDRRPWEKNSKASFLGVGLNWNRFNFSSTQSWTHSHLIRGFYQYTIQTCNQCPVVTIATMELMEIIIRVVLRSLHLCTSFPLSFR